jgi:hypothetical protein
MSLRDRVDFALHAEDHTIMLKEQSLLIIIGLISIMGMETNAVEIKVTRQQMEVLSFVVLRRKYVLCVLHVEDNGLLLEGPSTKTMTIKIHFHQEEIAAQEALENKNIQMELSCAALIDLFTYRILYIYLKIL